MFILNLPETVTYAQAAVHAAKVGEAHQVVNCPRLKEQVPTDNTGRATKEMRREKHGERQSVCPAFGFIRLELRVLQRGGSCLFVFIPRKVWVVTFFLIGFRVGFGAYTAFYPKP